MRSCSTRLRRLLDDGVDLDAALGQLREDGATPVEVIAAIREVLSVSLAQAKSRFAQCPAWAAEARAGDAFHEQIIDGFKDL